MMTPRERWLAAIRLQPVDRLPFWPKIGGSYVKAQAAPFDTMTAQQVHEYVGSDQHLGVPGVTREVHGRGTATTTGDARERRTVYALGTHRTELVMQFDAASDSWHPMAFPIRTRDDLAMMTEWFADRSFEVDKDGIANAEARKTEIGESAITTTGIGESPLMYFVEWLAGVEMAHYFLADAPDEVAALFAAIHAGLTRNAELVCAHSPADLYYMVENTSTTLISPAQYRQYCYPHLMTYAQIAKAHDKHMVLHMCGHLKLLLGYLHELPVSAFEAFTSPTVGNTTLLDGRRACPDTCLIGGTNAYLWTRSAAEIIATLERDLGELPHHRGIVVTSAGVMPPLCKPDTVKAVGDWVRRYPHTNG